MTAPKGQRLDKSLWYIVNVPNGIRTRVFTVKG
jgi:hypothetical protein